MLKEDFKIGKTVHEDVALKDFEAWAGNCVAEDDLILAPDLAEEMPPLISSDEVFMEPYAETVRYISGLSMACVSDPDRGNLFLLGTLTLLHVRSYALELVVFEKVNPQEEISQDRIRSLKARTQEWVEAVAGPLRTSRS